MAKVGRTDVFEREYKELFRAGLAALGEFVEYERDRGVRDIGIHFTHRLASGAENLTTALCWFQLKGIMSQTLPADTLKNTPFVSLRLEVRHLRYWYMQPIPTYLALYMQSLDTFLILNLKEYVAEHWGLEILKLGGKTAVVKVPLSSKLDDQALRLILRNMDSESWAQALKSTPEDAQRCHRDYALIWRIGTAAKRGVEHRVHILDWQSKLRGEIHFQERKEQESDWKSIRVHWQVGLHGTDIERAYPYLEFFPFGRPPPELSSKAEDVTESAEDEDLWADDNDGQFSVPALMLSNGTSVKGTDAAGEYNFYELGARLNALGRDLLAYVEVLIDVQIVTINEDANEFLSVAPWHHRAV